MVHHHSNQSLFLLWSYDSIHSDKAFHCHDDQVSIQLSKVNKIILSSTKSHLTHLNTHFCLRNAGLIFIAHLPRFMPSIDERHNIAFIIRRCFSNPTRSFWLVLYLVSPAIGSVPVEPTLLPEISILFFPWFVISFDGSQQWKRWTFLVLEQTGLHRNFSSLFER